MGGVFWGELYSECQEVLRDGVCIPDQSMLGNGVLGGIWGSGHVGKWFLKLPVPAHAGKGGFSLSWCMLGGVVSMSWDALGNGVGFEVCRNGPEIGNLKVPFSSGASAPLPLTPGPPWVVDTVSSGQEPRHTRSLSLTIYPHCFGFFLHRVCKLPCPPFT